MLIEQFEFIIALFIRNNNDFIINVFRNNETIIKRDEKGSRFTSLDPRLDVTLDVTRDVTRDAARDAKRETTFDACLVIALADFS